RSRPRPGCAMRLVAAHDAAWLLLLAGCAPIPQVTSVPGRPVTARDTSGKRGTAAPAVVHAAVDSNPSPEALAVLSTIPDPLKPSERLAPPAATRPAPAVVAPAVPETAAASPDTSVERADTVSSEIPTPSPTPVLGERPSRLWTTGADSAASDSARNASAGSTPQQPQASRQPAPSAPPKSAPPEPPV